MEPITFEDRVCGGLLGVAVGDALGVPVEGISRGRLEHNPVRDLLPAVRWGLPAGTWSDDTSLTLCLASSLAELGRLDVNDVAWRFVRWLDEGYWSPHGVPVGIGRTTRQAIGRLRRGIPPEQAGGRGEWSNGNGSLMRILPLALFYAEAEPPELIQAAHQVSSITHAHPRSQMACGIYCLVAQELLRGKAPAEAVDIASDLARKLYANPPFSAELDHFQRILGGKIGDFAPGDVRSSGYVIDTLEASLWCLCNGADFEQTVLLAVNLGGDTDTVGAVAGGLAGVCWGLRQIPTRWIEAVARSQEILDVGHQLATQAEFRQGAKNPRRR